MHILSRNACPADKPLIIRKSDGGFLYATTDLATIEYRVGRWNPAAIWYVVGAPQSLHFQQVFAAARKMGVLRIWSISPLAASWAKTAKLCGPVRARRWAGGALDEAIERAGAIVAEKRPELCAREAEEIARTIGPGREAELSQHR